MNFAVGYIPVQQLSVVQPSKHSHRSTDKQDIQFPQGLLQLAK